MIRAILPGDSLYISATFSAEQQVWYVCGVGHTGTTQQQQQQHTSAQGTHINSCPPALAGAAHASSSTTRPVLQSHAVRFVAICGAKETNQPCLTHLHIISLIRLGRARGTFSAELELPVHVGLGVAVRRRVQLGRRAVAGAPELCDQRRASL